MLKLCSLMAAILDGGRIKENLAGMAPWCVPFKIVSDSSPSPFKMAAVTKNRNFFNCPLLL
jgi:hypothetical protein